MLRVGERIEGGRHNIEGKVIGSKGKGAAEGQIVKWTVACVLTI